MLVHSSTRAPTSGWSSTSLRAPSTTSCRARSTSSSSLVAQDDAGELPAVVGAPDRGVEGGAGEGEVLLGERGPRDGEDAGPPAGREQGLDRARPA